MFTREELLLLSELLSNPELMVKMALARTIIGMQDKIDAALKEQSKQ